MLFLAISFYSCNEITVAQFVLTDENTAFHNISNKYWYQAGEKNLRPSDIFVIENANPNAQKKVWKITPFTVSAKNNDALYIRRKNIGQNKLVFQTTLWEKGKKISLFNGTIHNDSTMHFYGFNKAAMELISKSYLSDELKRHTLFNTDNIHFDSIASTDYKDEIINFIKTLSKEQYREEEIIIVNGTNDLDKINALLKK
jgi:hypothetical protein